MDLERPPSLRLIGLTGGIASGKSVVASCWRSLGIPVIDADAVTRRLSEPGGTAWEAIREILGPEVLGPAGRIDRRAVARAVFRDPALRQALERRVHPLVIREVSRRLFLLAGTGAPLAAVEAALVVESGLSSRFDRVVAVVAPLEQRIARARQRDGIPPQEVQARIAAQVPDEVRIVHSHEVLVNDGTLDALLRRARALALDILSDQNDRCVADQEGKITPVR